MTPEPQPAPMGVTVTLDAIYGVVQSTEARVIAIEAKLDELTTDSKDHETRIRSLEKKVWAAGGIGAGGGALIAYVVQMLGGAG